VLPVSVHGLNPGEFGEPFRLSDLDCDKSVLTAPDGTEHVVLSRGGRQIQLACRGKSVLHNTISLALPIESKNHSEHKLLTLERLFSLHETGRIVPDLFRPHPRSVKFQAFLQALDGSLAGARHRDIAIALYGLRIVERDWRAPDDYLRNRVRRRINRGHYLMTEGYRTLI